MTELYAELHCASAFSFLAGASVPENLVARAAELELPAIALLDRNGVYGAPRFHTKAAAISKGGGPTVRTHFGSEISVQMGGEARLPLLCATRKGYRNLCRMVTRTKLRAPGKEEGSALLHDLEEYAEGLLCLTGGEDGPLHLAFTQGGRTGRPPRAGASARGVRARQRIRRAPAPL